MPLNTLASRRGRRQALRAHTGLKIASHHGWAAGHIDDRTHSSDSAKLEGMGDLTGGRFMEVKEGETKRALAPSPPVQFATRVAARVLPPAVRAWARARWRARKHWPPVGWVYFGSLRRTVPISRSFGYDRELRSKGV